MKAVDPSYPLLPVARLLSAVGLLLVLLTSFMRQHWNLGVAFLCFWLFVESLIDGANTIIWSDNADIKLYVYCDIASHIQLITYTVKPMSTLIVIRRLYLIANLQSVDLPSQSARRLNLIVEWSLGLVIPLLVAGPLYYINQGVRFEVLEGFGCTNRLDLSILELLTIQSWILVPPLISIVFYYPRVAWTFYRQSKDINRFLRSNNSISRPSYFRIMVLASIDLLITLPIGIVNLVLALVAALRNNLLPFYWGWTSLHTNWEPLSVSYAEITADGTTNTANFYFINWMSPILAFSIFGLFGLTSEALASYWRVICVIGNWVGWAPTPRAQNQQASLGEIEFGEQLRDKSAIDIEIGLINDHTHPVTRDAGDSLARANVDSEPSSVPQYTEFDVPHVDAGNVEGRGV
ncbi:unnamed protein product [Peniophora sp. CBMAI 1063]|nr:unnamed protein product [Peniophora sp. CBMAI 1063]